MNGEIFTFLPDGATLTVAVVRRTKDRRGFNIIPAEEVEFSIIEGDKGARLGLNFDAAMSIARYIALEVGKRNSAPPAKSYDDGIPKSWQPKFDMHDGMLRWVDTVWNKNGHPITMHLGYHLTGDPERDEQTGRLARMAAWQATWNATQVDATDWDKLAKEMGND